MHLGPPRAIGTDRLSWVERPFGSLVGDQFGRTNKAHAATFAHQRVVCKGLQTLMEARCNLAYMISTRLRCCMSWMVRTATAAGTGWPE